MKCTGGESNAYIEEALHHLRLFLPIFGTGLGQLDNHTHVTSSQDGLYALDQLIKQPQELQGGERREGGGQGVTWSKAVMFTLNDMHACFVMFQTYERII